MLKVLTLITALLCAILCVSPILSQTIKVEFATDFVPEGSKLVCKLTVPGPVGLENDLARQSQQFTPTIPSVAQDFTLGTPREGWFRLRIRTTPGTAPASTSSFMLAKGVKAGVAGYYVLPTLTGSVTLKKDTAPLPSGIEPTQLWKKFVAGIEANEHKILKEAVKEAAKSYASNNFISLGTVVLVCGLTPIPEPGQPIVIELCLAGVSDSVAGYATEVLKKCAQFLERDGKLTKDERTAIESVVAALRFAGKLNAAKSIMDAVLAGVDGGIDLLFSDGKPGKFVASTLSQEADRINILLKIRPK